MLLVAALSAAGALTSTAQVFSVNMVGYINKTLPAGAKVNVVANQLNNKLANGSIDNTIGTLIVLPAGAGSVNTSFIKQGNGTPGFHDAAVWDASVGWGPGASITLNPGDAAYLITPGSFPGATLTFVGEVQLTSSMAVPNGISLMSTVVPQAGYLALPAGTPAGNLDPAVALNIGFPVPPTSATAIPEQVYYPDQGYQPFVWDSAASNWGQLPNTTLNPGPVASVGGGFLIVLPGNDPARTWNRTFTVGP